MKSLLLVVNIDWPALISIVSVFMIPGFFIIRYFFNDPLKKMAPGKAVIFYLFSGFLVGAFIFVFLLMILIGGVDYIP
ncbi:hypothetical protein ACFSJU_09820 [Paradesertivirga mongoliensis]|uniref:Uncharacterized protein n=1 Tax=Paradesertivirga mongoliensis TaxID=2100740 RepID=A0ABW4ZM27_9SPHI|nr:hypothetical protein [Pedobacter mongoliensis]